jgi:hypothetical protein
MVAASFDDPGVEKLSQTPLAGPAIRIFPWPNELMPVSTTAAASSNVFFILIMGLVLMFIIQVSNLLNLEDIGPSINGRHLMLNKEAASNRRRHIYRIANGIVE